jgi:hypothetical protein
MRRTILRKGAPAMAVALVFSMLTAATSAQEPAKLRLLADSVVDAEAVNFKSGAYGTAINGQTYQLEAVVTFKGYQYATYFASDLTVAVARRKLPDGPWEKFHLPDYTFQGDSDVHNVAVLGICEGDGTIHLSFDHHADQLKYRVSVPGLASRPEEFEWKAEHFGPIQSSLTGGREVRGITYPTFFNAPGGKLQLIYRLGGSGNGEWFLFEYNPADGKWSEIGLLFSRHGTYKDSNNRCAYPNPPTYDAAGRLHITWCWREAPPQGRGLRANHDLCYAYSDDAGRTWRANGGKLIADLTGVSKNLPKSIGIDAPGIVVIPLPYMWGQMNTHSQFVDAKRRVHMIDWHNPSDAPAASDDLNNWRYFHYWRDESGKWHENRPPFVGRKPQILVDKSGEVILVYTKGSDLNYHNFDPGGRLIVSRATEASGWTDWETIWTSDVDFHGEPLYDKSRWASEGILSIYCQEKPATPGEPSNLHVIDFGR